MTLEEYAHFLGKSLTEKEVDNGYICYFHNAHVQIGANQFCVIGRGNTRNEAKRDFAHKISNETLVFNITEPDQEDVKVPELR